MQPQEHTTQLAEANPAPQGEIGEYNRPAEQALLDPEEEMYRRFFRVAPIGIGVSDQAGSFLWANPSMESITGYTLEELRTIGISALYPDPMFRQDLLGALSEFGKVRNLEMRLKRKDGTTYDAALTVEQIEIGKRKMLLTMMHDITKRKRAEEALEESKDYLDQIINSIGDPVFVKDRQFRFVLVNDAMCAFAGRGRGELLGKTIYQLLPKEQADSIWKQEYLIFERGQECIVEEEVTDRKRIVHTVVTKKTPLTDKAGNILIVGIIRDITELNRAEKALRESEERYRTAIEHCNDGVAIAKGTINLFVNKRYVEMFGYDNAEEIVGKRASLIAHPDEIKRMEDIMLRRQRGESVPSRYEIRGIRKDGEPIDIEISATRTVYGGESVSLAYVRDITERKRAEKESENLQEQVRQSQKMEAVGVLAGGVAHDFNNLLSVINGYSELLLRNFAQEDPRHSDLEQIRQAAQRASSLTSQLLAFSRKQILQPRVLDLNDAITDMSKMLRRVIGEDIEFVCITRPGLGLVHADPGQIQQIVMNLVVNARDAMPQGGKLTIETANVDLEEEYVRKHATVSAGPYIMLAISDNGIGMDAETQARIFEPFFSTKGSGRGTGLGLSTVYGIVKQSDGFIWVYSEPGKGTTFKIYLPRVQGETAKFSVGAEEERDLRGSETVLVVEDESSVRALAARILREHGYTVFEASNGKEALRTAQEFAGEIHLVLTDVVMPEMSGKVLVSQMEAARPGIKALFFSGYTDNAIVHHGILESNVAFLQKPFAANVLVSKVREVIDSPHT